MSTLLAVGDSGVRRADCASMFRGCAAVLQAADLVFAQLETTVSARGARVPNARLAMRAPPAMMAAVRAAGIGVMSFAGNHCLDWGYEAFDDTLVHAATAGIGLCGAGHALVEARAPHVAVIGSTRIAFLAASSILPEGYAAEPDRPGCAPLRAHTLYEQIEHDQPGTPARIRSHAHRDDLTALVSGVRAAREVADLVMVSLHWGVHMVPYTLAEYQREVAHALIDAGADAILGHHPHLLKAVEIYRQRPVFYSLGNFAIEQPQVWDPAITHSASFRHLQSLNPSWNPHQIYMLPEVTRLSGAAQLVLDGARIAAIRFLPAWIEDDSAPRMLAPAEPEFERVRQFLQRSSAEAGMNTRFTAADGALLIAGD
jgi:poly-gamma-glutamate synthesis protein (capsule biosynthesis protein)